MIRGSFYILLFYFLGEMLSKLIGGFVPGSVLGMVLLFLALYFKVIKPESVKDVATSITKNMAVFFVPAGVGLMVYAELVSKSLAAILVAIAGSTILTIITVALVQENFEKRRAKNKELQK
ncbi:MAG: CidA/LrgA family protein [Bacteroidia bacterium]|nr:CidA/LrgA family protein [Paludibacter sp.]MDD3488826.1 CidA/LrgA family protein [Paludibacter sp.]NCB69223.1 CidA/LrgA family protein [Bacteroidia bacterium]